MIPFWIIGVFMVVGGMATFNWNLLLSLLTIAGGVVVIILYIIIAPKYPVRAQIFLKRHGNMRIVWDKATRMKWGKGEDTFKYRFKKLKDETKAAVYDNLYPSGKGEIAMFYSPAPGEYYQAIFMDDIKSHKKKLVILEKDGQKKEIEVNVEEATIEPIPDNYLEWMVNKQTRMKQKYMQVSAWDRYYPLIVVAVLAVIIVIVVSGLFNAMEPVVNGFKDASNNFKSASDRMAAAAERLAEKEEGTQVIGGSGQALPAPPDAG